MIKATTYRSGITYSLFLNVLSKGFLFITNLLIAHFFGINAGTDLYFYLFSCVLLCANFVIGINGSVIIPESKRLEDVHGRQASHGFVNRVFYTLVLALVLVSAVLMIFPIEIVSVISNFDTAILETHTGIIYLSAILLVVQIVVLFLNDLLTYYRYFVLPGAISLTNAVLTIVFIYFFHDRLGLQSILLAAIAAYGTSLFAQLFILKRYEQWNFFSFGFATNRATMYNAMYSILSIVTSILVSFVPLYLLSRYSSGAISNLVFAQRISEIPNTLLAIQFAAVVGVSLTEKYLQKDYVDFNAIFVRSAGVLFFLLIPVAVCIFFLSDDLIAVLFEHGALKDGFSNQISQVLSLLIIGVPFTGVNYLSTKVLIASQRIKESFVFNVILSAIHIVLAFVGIYQAAQAGYAAGFSVYCVLYFLTTYFLFRYVLPFVEYGKVIRSFLVFMLLNVVLMAAITALASWGIPHELHLLKLVVAGGAYVVSLLIINHYMGISPDIRDTVNNVINVILRRRKNG